MDLNNLLLPQVASICRPYYWSFKFRLPVLLLSLSQNFLDIFQLLGCQAVINGANSGICRDFIGIAIIIFGARSNPVTLPFLPCWILVDPLVFFVDFTAAALVVVASKG